MTADPDSPEAWAEIEANELRLWLSFGETGLWCPDCALPSGFTITIRRDPAEPANTYAWRCANDPTHLPESCDTDRGAI